MNTFLLTYSLQGGEPQDLLRAIGRSARLAAKDKKFTYEQGRTVGDYVQISGEWDTLLGDLRSALRLNLYGLLLVNVRVRLNNTFMAEVSPVQRGYRTFREGEKRLELYYDVERDC